MATIWSQLNCNANSDDHHDIIVVVVFMIIRKVNLLYNLFRKQKQIKNKVEHKKEEEEEGE